MHPVDVFVHELLQENRCKNVVCLADDGALQDVSVLQFKRDRVCVKRDLLTVHCKTSATELLSAVSKSGSIGKGHSRSPLSLPATILAPLSSTNTMQT
jgi:hypothetical protein